MPSYQITQESIQITIKLTVQFHFLESSPAPCILPNRIDEIQFRVLRDRFCDTKAKYIRHCTNPRRALLFDPVVGQVASATAYQRQSHSLKERRREREVAKPISQKRGTKHKKGKLSNLKYGAPYQVSKIFKSCISASSMLKSFLQLL